jgi:hypothetical protein
MLYNVITLLLELLGDGSSLSYSFDLLSEPYLFTSTGEAEIGKIQNWFADDRPAYRSVAPSGVDTTAQDAPWGGTYTASLSGTIVTVTFSQVIPSNEQYFIEVPVLF